MRKSDTKSSLELFLAALDWNHTKFHHNHVVIEWKTSARSMLAYLIEIRSSHLMFRPMSSKWPHVQSAINELGQMTQ